MNTVEILLGLISSLLLILSIIEINTFWRKGKPKIKLYSYFIVMEKIYGKQGNVEQISFYLCKWDIDKYFYVVGNNSTKRIYPGKNVSWKRI